MAKESGHIDARLRERGFSPDAPPDQAVATLQALRGADGVSDLMIARALGTIVAPAAVAMLVEMETGASGPLRREIRRSVFRLRQRGVESQPAEVPAAAAVAQTADSGLTGLLSIADADGVRIVWLVKTRGGGGLHRMWCLVSENAGLLAVSLEQVTRKQYRADRAEIESRAGTPLIEAGWRLADFIICEAYRRTPENRRGRVGNFLALRTELIATPPVVEFRHPIYDELAAALANDPPAELMQEPDVAGHRLPPAAIKPYVDEANSLKQSVIVLSRIQQEERVNTVVERAITELLTGNTADRLRRQLEDTAYFFLHSGKAVPAGWAAAAAARLRDGADLKRMPFFRALVRAQLGAVIAEQEEKIAEEPRLIMTPAEAMRARQAAQARMRGRGR